MDELVAERVMEFKWWKSSATGRRGLFRSDDRPDWFTERAVGDEPLCSDHNDRVPHFSTDVAAAMKLVESLKGIGGGVGSWITNRFVEAWVVHPNCKARGTSFPHALCLAALAAVELQ